MQTSAATVRLTNMLNKTDETGDKSQKMCLLPRIQPAQLARILHNLICVACSLRIALFEHPSKNEVAILEVTDN